LKKAGVVVNSRWLVQGDELASQQRADGAVAGGAPNALDAGLADRLSVRDDGQDLDGRPL
jgi:hypothetical protein